MSMLSGGSLARSMYLVLARIDAANVRRNNDMPRWNVDNLITHVAAAALIVDDFEVDVNDLREDLKIENKEYVIHRRSKDPNLTLSQDQTVLPRIRLQSRPTYTNRHDEVQVDQG